MKKLIYSKEDLDLILSLENEKKDKEIERLNRTNNEIFKANETLFEEIKKLQKQLQQKENIIKEVREYIEDRYDGEALIHTFDKDNVKELLEILGGENNDK